MQDTLQHNASQTWWESVWECQPRRPRYSRAIRLFPARNGFLCCKEDMSNPRDPQAIHSNSISLGLLYIARPGCPGRGYMNSRSKITLETRHCEHRPCTQPLARLQSAKFSLSYCFSTEYIVSHILSPFATFARSVDMGPGMSHSPD